MLEELASDHVSAEHAPGVLAERRRLPKVPARGGVAHTRSGDAEPPGPAQGFAQGLRECRALPASVTN